MIYDKDCITKAFDQSRAVFIGNKAKKELLGVEGSSDILLEKLEFETYSAIINLLNEDFEDLTDYRLFKAVPKSDRDKSLIIVNEKYPGISFNNYFKNYDGKPLTEDCFDTHNWYCKFDTFEECCLEDIDRIRSNKAMFGTFLLNVSENEDSSEAYSLLLDAFRRFFSEGTTLLLCKKNIGFVRLSVITNQGVTFVSTLSLSEFYKLITGKSKKSFKGIQIKLGNAFRRVGYSDWYVKIVHARLIKIPLYRKIIHKVYVKTNNTQN